MLVNWIVREVSSGAFVNDAAAIVAVPQTLREGVRTPILLDAARLDILGRTRRPQLLDLPRNMRTGRHVIHHEANECVVQILETLRRDGRVLGASSARKMGAASALEVDLAALRATDLEDSFPDGDVSGIDEAFFAGRVELQGERIVGRIVRRGQGGRATAGSSSDGSSGWRG